MHISQVCLVIKPLSRRHLCSRRSKAPEILGGMLKMSGAAPGNAATGILLISAHRESLSLSLSTAPHSLLPPSLVFVSSLGEPKVRSAATIPDSFAKQAPNLHCFGFETNQPRAAAASATLPLCCFDAEALICILCHPQVLIPFE
jgi:hypothetical protein